MRRIDGSERIRVLQLSQTIAHCAGAPPDMEFDAEILSRIQFGFTVGFHILFPTVTIGLAAFLAIVEWRWLRTGDDIHLAQYRFWVRLFAISFGMGVVTGIVLSYEVGTNFSRFSAATGDVLGPLFSYEVLTAFFLEAGFLGIMLFGWNRVGPRLHFAATLMVAVGTSLSAFWILSANSWMQTPAGHAVVDGRFVPVDWWAVVFNPSFPYRLVHMLLASYLTTSFVIAGVCAWYLLKGIHVAFARRGFSVAMWAAMVLAPAQIAAGDLHGLNVLEYQPMKVAAMEGLWRTTEGAPLVLFAWPDMNAETNRYSIAIPRAASLILKHDPDGMVRGLNEVPPGERPDVPIVFFAFRAMVGIGFFFLFLAACGLWLRWRGALDRRRWFLRLCVLASPLGFVAVIAGWIVAEVGRQPWVVHGLMRTAEAVSPVSASQVSTSLVLFVSIYGLLFAAFLYYAGRVVAKGPDFGPRDAEADRTIVRPAVPVED